MQKLFCYFAVISSKKYCNRKRDDLRGWRKFFSIEKKLSASLYYFDEKWHLDLIPWALKFCVQRTYDLCIDKRILQGVKDDNFLKMQVVALNQQILISAMACK